MKIYILTDNIKNKWNKFVQENNGSVYHLWEWGEIIENQFNSKKVFVVAEDNNHNLIGALPLYLTKDGRDKYLTSLPCTGFLNILATTDLIKNLLLDFCVIYAQKHKYRFEIYTSEILQNYISTISITPGGREHFFIKTNDKVETYVESLSSDKKRQIRKMGKLGILCKKANKKDIEHFFSLYCSIMKRLGFVPLRKDFFLLVYTKLHKYIYFTKSIYEKKPQAYIWYFIFGKKMYVWRVGHIRGTSKDSIYYEALIFNGIKKAFDDMSIEYMDFGCSDTNSGGIYFKSNLGFISEPVFRISYIKKSFHMNYGLKKYINKINLYLHSILQQPLHSKYKSKTIK